MAIWMQAKARSDLCPNSLSADDCLPKSKGWKCNRNPRTAAHAQSIPSQIASRASHLGSSPMQLLCDSNQNTSLKAPLSSRGCFLRFKRHRKWLSDRFHTSDFRNSKSHRYRKALAQHPPDIQFKHLAVDFSGKNKNSHWKEREEVLLKTQRATGFLSLILPAPNLLLFALNFLSPQNGEVEESLSRATPPAHTIFVRKTAGSLGLSIVTAKVSCGRKRAVVSCEPRSVEFSPESLC